MSQPSPEGRRYAKALLFVCLVPLILMTRSVDQPLHGHHVFRQAHVAANIETYLIDGLSLRPRTYNDDVPGRLFDFPAFQLAAAALTRLSALDPLAVARALNVALFGLTLLAIHRLLRATGEPALQRFLTLCLFALAPLNLFYGSAPMVDGPAMLLTVLALLGFVWWDRAGRRGGLWLWLGGGALATLVKSPVFLPAFVAVVWQHVRSRRGLRSLAFLGFLVLVPACVIGFKLYSDRVNLEAAALSVADATDYYGSLADRLRPASWTPILRTAACLILNPLTAALGVAGVVLQVRRARGRYAPLWLGLTLGNVCGVLVFFNRHRWHDYYQLPLALPLAYSAALGVRWLLACSRSWGMRGARATAAVRLGVVGAVLATSAIGAVVVSRALADSTPEDRAIAAAGEWVRSQTTPSDFVAYAVDSDEADWSPAYLYWAKRDGYNLQRGRVTRRELAALQQRFGPRYRRILVFAPEALARQVDQRLAALGARLVAQSEHGRLYELEARPASTLTRSG